MPNVQIVRQHLNRHPLLAILVVVAVAYVALPIAALLVLAGVLAMFWPTIERARSPEARVESALEARRRGTLEVVHSLTAIKVDETLLTREIEREAFQARRWEERATKALLAGDETEAALCMARKQEHDQKRALMLPELERQRDAAKLIGPQVEAMRRETRAAEQDGQLLAMRARRAAAKRSVVMTASGLHTGAGREAFDRMASDVARAEAEADALTDILGTQAEDAHADAWDAAERETAAQAELERLKQKVGMRRKALGT
jgi:phage shock protein A